MDKDILKSLMKLTDLMANEFVEINYIDKDVFEFIKEMRKFKEGSIDVKNIENFIKETATVESILSFICKALQTNKINNNRKDLIFIGNYLKELAEEIIEIGEKN